MKPNFPKQFVMIVLAFIILLLLAVGIFVGKWDLSYRRHVRVARDDFVSSHLGLLSASYWAFDIHLGDSEVAVDTKLARASKSNHLNETDRAFSKRYELPYGEPIINPDGTKTYLYVETFIIDFDSVGDAFFVHESLFRADDDCGSHEIDLRSGKQTSF
ncbi:MAG TPA: hypothetical protein VGN88_12365 [Phycisphaerae bacterium]|jgi:hypothetical protein